MANPVFVDCPADQYTLVAAAVVSGNLRKFKETEYFSTYRMTGEAAPTDKAEAKKIFVDGETDEPISASADIDVYLWVEGEDGRIRADL